MKAGPTRARPSGEAVITLVSIGVFTGVGWLVGVWFLWTQHVWSQRERIIGTAVPLAGLVTAFLSLPLWTAEEACRYVSDGRLVCTGGPTKLGDAVFVAALLGPPAFTAAYLARRLIACRRA